jgi:hypothetical protein
MKDQPRFLLQRLTHSAPISIEETLQRFDWFAEKRATTPVLYNEEKNLIASLVYIIQTLPITFTVHA